MSTAIVVVRSVLTPASPRRGERSGQKAMLSRSFMFQFHVDQGIEWSSLAFNAVLLLGKVGSESYTAEYVTSYEMLAFAAVLLLGKVSIESYTVEYAIRLGTTRMCSIVQSMEVRL